MIAFHSRVFQKSQVNHSLLTDTYFNFCLFQHCNRMVFGHLLSWVFKSASIVPIILQTISPHNFLLISAFSKDREIAITVSPSSVKTDQLQALNEGFL